MKKKILMIYPEFPATYWSYKYSMPFVGKKAVMPPLGLLTIASMLPDSFEVTLIDMNTSQISIRDIENSDMVFISAMIIQKDSFNRVIEMCNECGVTVVAGGPYPTSSYQIIDGVDHFILNEAEITLPMFLRDYENGIPERVYEDKTKPDLALTPPPRFDLIDVSDYLNMTLQFSRGCPFNCEFCDIIEMFGRNPRTKVPDQFIGEMEIVYNSGFRGPIFIVDDNFIGNKKEVKKLLELIILWQEIHKFPFTFFTEASVNLAEDDELMGLMVQANFDMVFVGIETPDTATLTVTHKNQNAAVDLFESIKKIQNSGLEVCGGFIIGFDTDPDNIFDLQINFIQRSGIPIAMIGLLIALPRTQLYRRLQSEHRLTSETNGNNTHQMTMNFKTVMPAGKIVEGYKRVIAELYSPQKFFERSLVLIRRLSKNKSRSTKLYWSDIRALMLSLLRQSFSRYGYWYLRFVIKSIRYNYRRFPQAIGMAVMGYHFFKITREILSKENRLAGNM